MPRLASLVSKKLTGIVGFTANLVAPFESDYTASLFQLATDGSFGNMLLASETTARNAGYWLQYSGGLTVNGSFTDGGFPGTPLGTLTVTLVKDATGAVTVSQDPGGEWFVWLAASFDPALAPGTITITGTAEPNLRGENTGIKETIPAGQVEISAANTASWQLAGGTQGLIRLNSDSDYTAFSQWVQSQGSFGTFQSGLFGADLLLYFHCSTNEFQQPKPLRRVDRLGFWREFHCQC